MPLSALGMPYLFMALDRERNRSLSSRPIGKDSSAEPANKALADSKGRHLNEMCAYHGNRAGQPS